MVADMAKEGNEIPDLTKRRVRELLADSTFREIGNFVPFLGHIGHYFASVSKLPAYGI